MLAQTCLIKLARRIQATLVAQTVMNPPATPETQVQSLGQEHPLEKGMATHCSILAWGIPWTEKPRGLQSMRSQSQTHVTCHLTKEAPGSFFPS